MQSIQYAQLSLDRAMKVVFEPTTSPQTMHEFMVGVRNNLVQAEHDSWILEHHVRVLFQLLPTKLKVQAKELMLEWGVSVELLSELEQVQPALKPRANQSEEPDESKLLTLFD